MKNSQQDSLDSARYWFLLSHALKLGQDSNSWREEQQLFWKEPNWKAHCPREKRSPAAAQHGTRNRLPGKQKTWTETAWKLREKTKGTQKVKAGDYITLRPLPLVRCERVDASPPRQKAKTVFNFVRRIKKSSWVTAQWSTGCMFGKVKAVYLF